MDIAYREYAGVYWPPNSCGDYYLPGINQRDAVIVAEIVGIRQLFRNSANAALPSPAAIFGKRYGKSGKVRIAVVQPRINAMSELVRYSRTKGDEHMTIPCIDIALFVSALHAYQSHYYFDAFLPPVHVVVQARGTSLSVASQPFHLRTWWRCSRRLREGNIDR
jgi:hypothetical protein